MTDVPHEPEPPVSRSGERRIAERRLAPTRVGFDQMMVICNGCMKLVVGVYFIALIAWRSLRPGEHLLPSWVAAMFGVFFIISWMVDGYEDIRRGVKGLR